MNSSHEGIARGLAFSSDGQWIISAAARPAVIRVWNAVHTDIRLEAKKKGWYCEASMASGFRVGVTRLMPLAA